MRVPAPMLVVLGDPTEPPPSVLPPPVLPAVLPPERVTSISPGYVETEFAEIFSGRPGADAALAGRLRTLEARDVAEAVLWVVTRPAHVQVHDVLLRWRKDPSVKPRFNVPYEPLAASTLATWGTKAKFRRSSVKIRLIPSRVASATNVASA